MAINIEAGREYASPDQEQDAFDTSADYVDTMVGWKKYEVNPLEAGKVTPIDIILLDFLQTINPRFFQNRTEIIAVLQDLQEQVDFTTPQGEYLRDQIVASIAYIEAEQGKPIDYLDYLAATLGSVPQSRPREELLAQHAIVADMMAEQGNSYTNAGREAFVEANRLSSEAIRQEFANAERMLPILQEIVGYYITPESPTITIEIVEEDDYWLVWFDDSSPNSFRLRFNIHSRHRNSWMKGTAENLYVHEMTHYLVAAKTQQDIRENRLHPGNGIGVIPSPDQWRNEGGAEIAMVEIPSLYEQFTPAGKLAAQRRLLGNMVKNNVYLQAYALLSDNPEALKDDELGDELFEYYTEFMPHETRENFVRNITSATQNKAYISYFNAYTDGSLGLYDILQQLPEEQDKIAFLNYCFAQPRTPNQIKRYAATILPQAA